LKYISITNPGSAKYDAVLQASTSMQTAVLLWRYSSGDAL